MRDADASYVMRDGAYVMCVMRDASMRRMSCVMRSTAYVMRRMQCVMRRMRCVMLRASCVMRDVS